MTSPAAEVRTFKVTIPSGTAESAPYTTSVSFPTRVVVAVDWKVPPGPSGLMGWRLSMAGGVAVIPYGGGWIITDDQAGTWPVKDQPDSGAWEVTGYNTDAYDHAVYLTFLLDLVQQSAPPAVLIPSSALASAASASTAPPAGG